MKGWSVQPQYYYKLPIIYDDIFKIEQYNDLDCEIVRDQFKLTLNKEKCLRLADLHFLLNIQYKNQACKYTKLCQFQVLQVIRMIAEHLSLIKQKELVHNNLNKKNIWIRFGQNNLSTYYQKELQIEQIYFVNYDCQQNQSQYDFKSIYIIFEEFIENLKNNELKNIILEMTLQITDTQSLNEFIKLVKDLERAQNINNQKPDSEINQINQPGQNQFKSQIRIKSDEQQQVNQTQQSFKILGYNLPKLGIKEKVQAKFDQVKTFFNFDESNLMNKRRYIYCNRCITKKIDIQNKNDNDKDQRLNDLKQRLEQHLLDCLYKEQFRMFAYDFTKSYLISDDETINNWLKIFLDSVQTIINSIFKRMESDFLELEKFTQQMDQVFETEFKMDLGMKEVDIKQIYCDLLYQWLTNDVQDLQEIFNANIDGIKPILMKKSKIQYQRIHKKKFEEAVQQLVNALL